MASSSGVQRLTLVSMSHSKVPIPAACCARLNRSWFFRSSCSILLDGLFRDHLVRDLNAMHKNTLDLPRGIPHRLIDKIEIALFRLTARYPVKDDLHGMTEVRLAASVNLFQQLGEDLIFHLGQAFQEGLAHEVRGVTSTRHTYLIFIHIGPALAGSTQESDGSGRLRQEFLQSVALQLCFCP